MKGDRQSHWLWSNCEVCQQIIVHIQLCKLLFAHTAQLSKQVSDKQLVCNHMYFTTNSLTLIGTYVGVNL